MCSNCEECVYNRMCGSKEKYKQMIKEYNELNKKWDIFKSNPPCPEFKDIDTFAKENGYKKDEYSNLDVSLESNGSQTVLTIKPKEKLLDDYYKANLEKIFQECGLNPVIIGDSSFVKEAKRVNEDLEKKFQKAYEELLKGLLNS